MFVVVEPIRTYTKLNCSVTVHLVLVIQTMAASVALTGDCPAPGNLQCTAANAPELLSVGPVMLLIIAFLLSRFRLPKTNESWSVTVGGKSNLNPMPHEVVLITKCWSVGLLIGTLAMLVMRVTVSVPLQLLISSICMSGLLIEHPLSQSIFHLGSTCTWFVLFDAIMHASPQTSILTWVLSAKGALFVYMVCGTVCRLQHGNHWQYSDPSHALLGFLLIVSYFWIVDLPVCALDPAGILCDFTRRSSNMYVHGSGSNRAVEVVKMAIAHIILNVTVYVNRIEFSSPKDEIEEGLISDESKSTDVQDFTRRFSGATDTEDDNQTVSDENGQQRKLPADCVEISEAEAIEIIQNGLNNFKKKRAT